MTNIISDRKQKITKGDIKELASELELKKKDFTPSVQKSKSWYIHLHNMYHVVHKD